MELRYSLSILLGAFIACSDHPPITAPAGNNWLADENVVSAPLSQSLAPSHSLGVSHAVYMVLPAHANSERNGSAATWNSSSYTM